jgi:hypothetical protein
MCVYTFFSTDITIDGHELPRQEAGIWGLLMWHGIILVSGLGTVALHYLVEGFNWVLKKIFK